MRSFPEGIQFRPTSLSKQSRPGNPSKHSYSHPSLRMKDCAQSKRFYITYLGQSPFDQLIQIRRTIFPILYKALQSHYIFHCGQMDYRIA